MSLAALHELCLAGLVGAALLAALHGCGPAWGIAGGLLAVGGLGLVRAQRSGCVGPASRVQRLVAAAAGAPLALGAMVDLLQQRADLCTALQFFLATLLRALGAPRSRRRDGQAVLLACVALLVGCLRQEAEWAVPLALLGSVALAAVLWCQQLAYGVWPRPPHAPPPWRRTARVDRAFVATLSGLLFLLLGTAALSFLLLPRLWGPGQRLFGRQGRALATRVGLGEAPRGAGDPEEILVRLRGVGAAAYRDGLYLRGVVLDADRPSGTFERRLEGAPLAPAWLALAADAAPRASYEVAMQLLGEQVLFSLGAVTEAQLLPSAGGANALGRSPLGELLLMLPSEAPLRYRVSGSRLLPEQQGAAAASANTPLPPAFTARFLALPAELDPRIAALAAATVTGASTAAAKVARLQHYLRQHATYALQTPAAQAADPLVDFLFVSHRGHCEFFAAALAVLLRAVDVPTRVVGGYAWGAWDPETQQVLFSAADAHAWVEWYDASAGWRLADATPPEAPRELRGWEARMAHLRDRCDALMQFEMNDQLTLLRTFAGWAQRSGGVRLPHRLWARGGWQRLALAAGLVAAAASAWLLFRRRRRRRAAMRQRGAPPQEALSAALQWRLEQLLQGGLSPSATLREGVAKAAPRLSDPAQRLLLQRALSQQEKTFQAAGPCPAAPEALALTAALRQVSRWAQRDA